MAALSASGEPGDEFAFMGFIPRSGAQRTRWLEALIAEPRTTVFFEAPHRMERLLAELPTLLVERPIHVFKELSKINEFYVNCTNTSSSTSLNLSGEFVIVVGKSLIKKDDIADDPKVIDVAVRMFGCLTDKSSFGADEAERLVSSATSLDVSVIRKAVKKSRIAQKRRDEALS
jgi:16S rRNA (cytidine1402-2'-O)-methyltransferase